MTHAELTCRELVELVTDYFERALPPPEQARFDEHLMACAPCQAHLDQMRGTIDLVGRLTEASLSPDAERDLLQAFRDWKRA